MADNRKKQHDFSDKEAARRFEQALHGARLASPTPLKDIPPKRPAKQRKAKKQGPAK